MFKQLLAVGAGFCVVIGLAACTQFGEPASSDNLPQSSAESGESNPEPGGKEKEPELVIPITYAYQQWKLQGLEWIEDTKLMIVFEDKASRKSDSEITEKSIVLYDLSDRSERLVFSFSDSGGLGDIRSNENEILLTTSEMVYTFHKSDFALLNESPNRGRDWGANTFEGLSADRDGVGIIIRSRDNPAESIRVAAQTEQYFFDLPCWSPDGKYILYYKYFGYVDDPINICVADRDGNGLWEFEIPKYLYWAYWSSNSRYIMTIATGETSGMTRLLDIETGKEIAARMSPYANCFGDCRDVYESTAVYWRQNEGANDYTVYTFDVLTGDTKDIVTMGKSSDIKFSPDGSLLAVIEGQNPGEIQFFKSYA